MPSVWTVLERTGSGTAEGYGGADVCSVPFLWRSGSAMIEKRVGMKRQIGLAVKCKPFSPELDAYYRELDIWLGPGGVIGWLERRRVKRVAEKTARMTRDACADVFSRPAA